MKTYNFRDLNNSPIVLRCVDCQTEGKESHDQIAEFVFQGQSFCEEHLNSFVDLIEKVPKHTPNYK